jgi:hypothetical protein
MTIVEMQFLFADLGTWCRPLDAEAARDHEPLYRHLYSISVGRWSSRTAAGSFNRATVRE